MHNSTLPSRRACRTAIQLTMNHPVAGAAVQERFERQLERNGIPQVRTRQAQAAAAGTGSSSGSDMHEQRHAAQMYAADQCAC